MIYVFRAKRADKIKLLYWDGTGMVLMAKTLEQGVFRWPKIQDGAMRLWAYARDDRLWNGPSRPAWPTSTHPIARPSARSPT